MTILTKKQHDKFLRGADMVAEWLGETYFKKDIKKHGKQKQKTK